MKRPEKKVFDKDSTGATICFTEQHFIDKGYNQCHDDHTPYIEWLKKSFCDNCSVKKCWEIVKEEGFSKYPSVEEIKEKLLRPTKSKEMNINFGVVNEYKARFLAQAIDRLNKEKNEKTG